MLQRLEIFAAKADEDAGTSLLCCDCKGNLQSGGGIWFMAAVGRYGDALCAGELVDHYGVFVNDALCLDHFTVQRWVGGASGLDAELMEIFVVGLHPES